MKQMTIALSLAAFLGTAEAAEMPKVGQAAPDFFLRDLDGMMHRLSDMAFPGKETSYRKKKKVLLDFFRTDCKPCMLEYPHVRAYSEKHKDEIQVIMIALLEEDLGREKLDEWLQTNQPPFPVLVDAYETVAKKYIVRESKHVLPSLFLIDENGVIRAYLSGLNVDLEAELQQALGGGKEAGGEEAAPKTDNP